VPAVSWIGRAGPRPETTKTETLRFPCRWIGSIPGNGWHLLGGADVGHGYDRMPKKTIRNDRTMAA